MRGRKPKPTKIKELAGNPGKRPLNQGEPKPKVAMMQVPRHLDEEGQKEWRRVARELYQLGLLTKIDRAALAAYCQAYSRWVQASEDIKDKQLTMLTENGYAYPNPLLGIINNALEVMRKFGVEFGMTPSSRSRLKVEPPEEPDELDKLLFGANVKVKSG